MVITGNVLDFSIEGGYVLSCNKWHKCREELGRSGSQQSHGGDATPLKILSIYTTKHIL